ncbi:MAG: hypothetical protein E7269_03785 [Lachnospiraceae bacterium]|nr:hypothetical protein [Lachnospiraceae bacterium]
MNGKLLIAFKYFVKVKLAGSISIALLSIFTIIYNSSGVHIYNTTKATDYKWESNQLKTTMTEGFAWFFMDADGFNNAYAKSETIGENPDILLMGSSHMEACNIAPNENVGYKLNELLQDTYTYNIGTSGHTIYHCVSNLENAIDTYNPTQYVILETSNITLDSNTVHSVIDGSFKHIVSYDSGLLYWVQKNIPAVKILYKQLVEWKDAVASNDTLEIADEPCKNTNYDDDIYRKTVDEFLSYAVKPIHAAGSTLIIFYHPPVKLDSSGELIETTDAQALNVFKSVCEENDIMFVDMTEIFINMYEDKHILPYGFQNTAVGVGHLNQYGHEAIAEKLAEVIGKDRE